MFEYNRFDKEKFLESYRRAAMKNGALLIPEYMVEINLADVAEPEKADFDHRGPLIEEVLVKIPDWDNAVQASCEADCRKFDMHERNFKFSLSYIDVSENEAALCYWGDEVNSEFFRIFVKDGTEWIMQDTDNEAGGRE